MKFNNILVLLFTALSSLLLFASVSWASKALSCDQDFYNKPWGGTLKVGGAYSANINTGVEVDFKQGKTIQATPAMENNNTTIKFTIYRTLCRQANNQLNVSILMYAKYGNVWLCYKIAGNISSFNPKQIALNNNSQYVSAHSVDSTPCSDNTGQYSRKKPKVFKLSGDLQLPQ